MGKLNFVFNMFTNKVHSYVPKLKSSILSTLQAPRPCCLILGVYLTWRDGIISVPAGQTRSWSCSGLWRATSWVWCQWTSVTTGPSPPPAPSTPTSVSGTWSQENRSSPWTQGQVRPGLRGSLTFFYWLVCTGMSWWVGTSQFPLYFNLPTLTFSNELLIQQTDHWPPPLYSQHLCL